MNLRSVALLLLAALPLTAAHHEGGESHNKLTPAEKADGWALLFDGHTLQGWTGMKGSGFPSRSWTLADGMLQTLKDPRDGDLATVKKYDNFELAFDFKVSPKGNSGLKYLVQQEWLSPHWSPEMAEDWNAVQWLSAVGYEYQIFDDSTLKRKPGWELSSLGAFYLIYAPEAKKPNPPGEWNSARVLVDGPHVEHWLNGEKILEYELGSEETLKRVAATKFRAVPGFGKKGPGHIVLQHHDSPAWFRNLKIRELD